MLIDPIALITHGYLCNTDNTLIYIRKNLNFNLNRINKLDLNLNKNIKKLNLKLENRKININLDKLKFNANIPNIKVNIKND